VLNGAAIIFSILACHDAEHRVTIAASGDIPMLVQPGSPPDVQQNAASALRFLLATDAKNGSATLASVQGAMPLLVHLLGLSSPVLVQVSAVGTLLGLAPNSENAALIAAAGAIPLLVHFLDPGDGPPAMMQGYAAEALGRLAVSAGDAATIAASCAIPLLVQLQ
jgi:hypothetical protein